MAKFRFIRFLVDGKEPRAKRYDCGCGRVLQPVVKERAITALTLDVRELSFAEIDMVTGGNWFSDLAAAVAHFAGQLMEMVENGVEWLLENFTVTYKSDGSVTVSTR